MANKFLNHSLNSTLPYFQTLIEKCSAMPQTRIVFLSSSTVYGNFESDAVDENSRCNPFGIYATLKYCCELLFKSVGENSELNYSIARPSALYGERCISRRVSQVFLENTYRGHKNIFRGLKDEKLDFTYISDLVDGLVKLGFHSKAYRQIFNLTYGNAVPVLSTIDILSKFFPKIKIELEDRNQATPIRGTLLNSKAKDLLGFAPKYSFYRGYPKYIKWFLSHLKKNNLSC